MLLVYYITFSGQKSPDDTFVGYSGYAGSQLLRRGDPINFPNQLCNVGNHFSRYRFTCPYTGIYFVSVTCRKSPSYRVDAIVKRGNTYVLRSSDNYNSYTYVTNNVLVSCNKGEYIKTRAGSKSYVYASGSYPENIFTVMSVHREGNFTHIYCFSALVYISVHLFRKLSWRLIYFAFLFTLRGRPFNIQWGLISSRVIFEKK